MNESELLAIGAADGRYREKTTSLTRWVSEFGLIRLRVQVECEWFLFLSEQTQIPQCPQLSSAARDFVESIVSGFDIDDAAQVKAFEATTNHDVKAVEYFVKARLRDHPELSEQREWVHFACTSEDINNTAYGLMMAGCREHVLLPDMRSLIAQLEALAVQHADLPMLSRTHGQAASPTTLGKEIRNVTARLARQLDQFSRSEILAKFNGAVGNFNAHQSAFPEIDWPGLSADFITRLGLVNNPWTTQIEPHDYLAELFHCLSRFNQIVLDFDRDVWSYIAIEYFKQRKVEGETGSSTMPHKINPIDFENSEGNIGVANALLNHMAEKLPVSRWQRDLSDSTVLRNVGPALAHCCIAYAATGRGLSRLEVNSAALARDLDSSWEVLAEPVQTVMRKHGLAEPYEQLKAATRGRQLDPNSYQQLLQDLDLPDAARAELSSLTPATYIGAAASLARRSTED
jgi:adenylosuccinate lyase